MIQIRISKPSKQNYRGLTMDEKLAFDDYNDYKLVVANIEETFQGNSIIMLNMPHFWQSMNCFKVLF